MSNWLDFLRKQDKASTLIGIGVGVLIFTSISTQTKVLAYGGQELPSTQETSIEEVIEEAEEVLIEDEEVLIEGAEVDEYDESYEKSSVAQNVTEGVLDTKTSSVIDTVSETVAPVVKDAVDKYNESMGDASDVPNWEEGCKSYNITFMNYTAVTSVNSRQYQLLNGEEAYTDPVTGIRMVGDRYCIALGWGYTHEVGAKVDLYFEDGKVVNCILGDCKASDDTDPTGRYQKYDGSVAEFVVDKEYFNSTDQWNGLVGGKILKVVVL